MSITEQQYDDIVDELDAHDFFLMGDLAGSASNANLLQALDRPHSLAKPALEFAYDETTHDRLERFHEEIEEIRNRVIRSMEALEKIDDVLSKADEVLSDALYSEDAEDESL
ncbi:MAG: hypothetical protein ACR2P1_27135 [Pseudomonadales bacterium]